MILKFFSLTLRNNPNVQPSLHKTNKAGHAPVEKKRTFKIAPEKSIFCLGENCAISTTTTGEARASRYHLGTPETPPTSRQYGTEKFRGSSQFIPRDAERRYCCRNKAFRHVETLYQT